MDIRLSGRQQPRSFRCGHGGARLRVFELQLYLGYLACVATHPNLYPVLQRHQRRWFLDLLQRHDCRQLRRRTGVTPLGNPKMYTERHRRTSTLSTGSFSITSFAAIVNSTVFDEPNTTVLATSSAPEPSTLLTLAAGLGLHMATSVSAPLAPLRGKRRAVGRARTRSGSGARCVGASCLWPTHGPPADHPYHRVAITRHVHRLRNELPGSEK